MSSPAIAPSSGAQLRQQLAAQLVAARARTDALFKLVTEAALFERPIAERHRLIFYLGHLEAFDWNLVCRDALGQAPLNASFEKLFAFGIDPLDGQSPGDAPSDWPSAAQIRAWGAAARGAVDEAIARAPLAGWLEGGWAARIAIEHRLMHEETLCYLLQRTPLRLKRPGLLPTLSTQSAVDAPIHIPAGLVALGLSRATAPHLGWDNEYEQHAVQVPAFTVSRLPVSNAQWLEFLEAGGYQERAWWSDAAWAWRAREGISHPAFWRLRDGQWWWVAMFGEVPLPGNWPVYVSHAEASAYARWKGARLPTEAQWQRAAFGSDAQPYPWAGATASPSLHGNFGGVRFDPVANGSSPGGDSPFGVADLMGNGWEWTSSVFAPFAGFEPLPFYPGYSANFFDGQHFVMKGASAPTDAAFLRPSFRNWFQPHYQHVFAKFRLVTHG